MPVRILRAGPPEWGLVRDVRLRALADAPDAFGSSFDEASRRHDDWWRSTVATLAWFVALEGSAAVGVIAGVPPAASGDGPGSLESGSTYRAIISIWVAPSHRRQGVARALVETLSDWARADGATSLTLRVTERNEPARRFYQQLGFVPGGPEVCGPPERARPALRMDLVLPAACLRIAPSPAGALHVGHVRTSIHTWILARQLHGRYFVRFEKTDRQKEVPGSRDAIVADLQWLDLVGAEEPRDQADLTDAHRSALDGLLSRGQAYPDDGAIRFRNPSEGSVSWDDLARGPMSVANADLGDPVLVRRDRTPTFFLASSVDDAVDGVTHLVRPDPMRRLMAQQIHIWRCLGYPPPRIGHIPLVTAANRAPLRTGQTDFTIAALRARGISADALVMYLAMPKTASWKIPPTGPGDIVSSVDLGRVSRRPFTFDLRAVELLSRRLARARRHLPLESAQVLCG